MSVNDVTNAFKAALTDGRITKEEVPGLLKAPGKISQDEETALKDQTETFRSRFNTDALELMTDSLQAVFQTRREASKINVGVAQDQPALKKDIQARLSIRKATQSFGGTPLPKEVKQVMNAEYKRGAVAYDVREQNSNPVYDDSHGEGEIVMDGKYNPYSQEQPAVDSMSFDHTELTPDKIKKDMETVQTFNVLERYIGSGDDQRATFKQATLKGSGCISSSYDEALWTDTLARSRLGDKHASNFAILADGSVHAVPFSRRTRGDPGRILTTASLARGKQMVFNGHIEMRSGVITYVGMSGRLGKLKEDGTKFVDPIAILKAWGFQLTPGLTVTQE